MKKDSVPFSTFESISMVDHQVTSPYSRSATLSVKQPECMFTPVLIQLARLEDIPGNASVRYSGPEATHSLWL